MPEFNIDGPGPPSGWTWWKEEIIEFPAFSGDSRAAGLDTMSRAIGRGSVRIEIPMLTVISLAFKSLRELL